MQKQKKHHHEPHVPVLLREVLALLDPKPGESYLDLTAGYGGHAREVIKKTNSPERAVLVDRDQKALRSLQDLANLGAVLIHSDFAGYVSRQGGKRRFDMILIDLGVSSPQLSDAKRGFSFLRSGPLDMRMDESTEQTAADLINTLPRGDLTKILLRYGEEPHAGRIADVIIANRPLQTTEQLRHIIEKTLRRRGKIHPATRTFQALRIVVNDELGQLQSTLPKLIELLNPEGRLAVISFHSLEDRFVKQFFREQTDSGYESTLRTLTKKPISGSIEAVLNPPSRSAKLRAGVKINTQERS